MEDKDDLLKEEKTTYEIKKVTETDSPAVIRKRDYAIIIANTLVGLVGAGMGLTLALSFLTEPKFHEVTSNIDNLVIMLASGVITTGSAIRLKDTYNYYKKFDKENINNSGEEKSTYLIKRVIKTDNPKVNTALETAESIVYTLLGFIGAYIGYVLGFRLTPTSDFDMASDFYRYASWLTSIVFYIKSTSMIIGKKSIFAFLCRDENVKEQENEEEEKSEEIVKEKVKE